MKVVYSVGLVGPPPLWGLKSDLIKRPANIMDFGDHIESNQSGQQASHRLDLSQHMHMQCLASVVTSHCNYTSLKFPSLLLPLLSSLPLP